MERRCRGGERRGEEGRREREEERKEAVVEVGGKEEEGEGAQRQGRIVGTLSWFVHEPFLFLGMLISIRALVIVIQGVTTHTWARPANTHTNMKYDTASSLYSLPTWHLPSCIITAATSAVLVGSHANSITERKPT